MKKAISVLLCVVLVVSSVFAMAGCTKQKQITNDIVLITDGGTVTDKSYNQSAWEGVTSFASENSMTSRYYQPVLDENGELTSDNVEKYVSLAKDNGAQYIVLPGKKFEVPAYEIASSYPDVNFILVDGTPHSADDETDHYVNNVMCVSFDNLQSGYLAGYIAVASGNTKLGYFGQYNSKDSANYGAGFAQGAAAAADELGIPVTLDWADYDSPLLDYDYSFNLVACYDKISDIKDKTFTVKVENGIGSGTYTEGSNVTITADPAPKGKVFDKWEVKSNTDGVKDKKVNISSKTKSSMNLLVEKCDCTITATYKDAEGKQYDVKVNNEDGTVYSQQYVGENSSVDVKAPVAKAGEVFDHWNTNNEDAVEDLNAKETKVNVSNSDIELTPVYKASEEPTFTVNVVTGEGGDGESTGSGAYVEGDTVELSAAVPKKGYMFSHWENKDSYGIGAGVAIENEYYWNTSFSMVDRFASICEKMFDKGVTLAFAGGNERSESVYTAKYKFDESPSVIEAGANHDNEYCAVVKNYGEAVQDCLKDFNGGSVFNANASTDGIYVDALPENTKEEKAVKEKVDNVYKSLADGVITPIRAEGGAGYDFCKSFNEKKSSKCLTLNGWFVDATTK